MHYKDLEPAAKKLAWATVTKMVNETEFYDENVTEDFKEALGLFGFNEPKMTYSGFYCQGDGASFEARWYARKFDYAAIKHFAPVDTDLQGYAVRMLAIAMRDEDAVYSVSRLSSRYSHEYTMSICDGPDTDDAIGIRLEIEDELLSVCRGLAQWYYARLEEEYDYGQSDDTVTSVANETDFNEDGSVV